jgi:hypothetical protein
MTTGSKAQVFHGTAKHTVGGLTKADLMQTNSGRIVSKKQHEAGKKAIQRLRNAGYVAKKGEFKLFTKKAAKPTRTRAQHTRAFTAAVKSKKAATRAARKTMKRNSKANSNKSSTRKSGGKRRSFW